MCDVFPFDPPKAGSGLMKRGLVTPDAVIKTTVAALEMERTLAH